MPIGIIIYPAIEGELEKDRLGYACVEEGIFDAVIVFLAMCALFLLVDVS